ncbi:hypothetical protein Vadar_029100 [Vaccinium darrowii]|uniref:Uncharacterized protein n=1 Tax=Vaccinium darrowii TaxID=229202 RepID=A0ACB7XKT1_9ERIC|nr:hypothetical protein Vadar_029100 [Vaccinium darrowii]
MQVEELAFLVKDNLPCKHLVLSKEEAFINFLQEDPSLDGVLELEPMNAYNRLLLHRLADIFGFSHRSVGEGDDRHLILECCPETSIPPVLVSDLLWQYDGVQPPTTSHQLLTRNQASTGLKAGETTNQFSLEEREAAYLAARERIFIGYDGETSEPMKRKPQSNPVVARRMIAHALGGKINPSNQALSLRDTKEYGEVTNEKNIQEKEQVDTNLSTQTHEEANILSTKIGGTELGDLKRSTPPGTSRPRRSEVGGYKENLKEEHMGAAKRMFAHALGRHSAKDRTLSKCSEMKQTE